MAIDDLMKASRKELDEVKEKYSAENLVNEKQKIRAINAAASTCSRLANRLSASESSARFQGVSVAIWLKQFWSSCVLRACTHCASVPVLLRSEKNIC